MHGNVHRRSHAAFATLLIASLVLLTGPWAEVPSARGDSAQGATLHVLGARVNPLKPKGKPWDADHGSIPYMVYHQLGGASGFPPLTLLSLVPYRNRPDPYVVVEAKEVELARSKAVQGSFLPAWGLEVPLAPGDARPTVLTFRVVDDDLRDDDDIGKALVDVEALLATPGPHRLEGSGGLHDLTVVVRNPAAEGAGPEQTLVIEALKVTVREQRPAGGDWDAGGNPLKRRFPRLPFPKEAEGMTVVRPDPQVTVSFPGGGRKRSEPGLDTFEHEFKEIGLIAKGRTGTGDGLFVRVMDKDLALSDPVGVLYVPFEDLLAAREKGVLEVEPDADNGIERVVVTFRVGTE